MWVNAKTKVYAVIGNPVEHSLSPAIHNAAYRQLNLNCIYLAFRVTPGLLPEAVRGLRSLGVGGFNVTIPHKVAVMRLLDRVEPLAKRIGAVNTVKNVRGKLVGYSTDGDGALMALTDEGVHLEGGKLVVVGAGGAARAITFSLAKLAGELVILNRTASKAVELSSALSRIYDIPVKGEKLSFLTLRRELRDCDVLINATSVGMHPEVTSSPVDKDLIKPGMTVFDIVYKPLRTKLLKDAEERGAKTVGGIKMLVYQAVKSFEIWTGRKIKPEVMLQAAMRELGEN